MRLTFISVLLAFVALPALAQTQPDTLSDPPHREWHASWVTHPTASLREPLVLHFRRFMELNAVPTSYPVRVSADNRFILYVNGNRVGDGPARGDIEHWHYEYFDLAPFLKAGKNLITATVWNFGLFAPVAQFTDRTAFLLESEAAGASSISTPMNWQVEIESGHQALDRSSVLLKTYMATGPGEEIDAAHYDWKWNSAEDTNSGWVAVASPMRDSVYNDMNKARSADVTEDVPWGLTPDRLPQMEYAPTSAGKTVRSEMPELMAFPATSVTVPAGRHVHILLDRNELTTAYPHLTVSGGKGTMIRITYSEALYDKNKHKGDRDEVGDRQALGLMDSFLPDGGQHRSFEPLWWRTWRYMDLNIETAGEPLKLESLTAAFTAYPFKQLSSFHSPDTDLDKIQEISWRTARLDAHETYMDTPYYEQLQYVGDTRIQALISYAVANDDRLARQALEAFNQSRIPDGITRSRYPSSLPQNIPTFSLLWIGMLHDWWMYRPDPAPVRESLQGTRDVLHWFAQFEQPDGLLRKLPWWSFIDWVPTGEIPTYDANGESCVTTLQYLGALHEAEDLEQHLGDKMIASNYLERESRVFKGLRDKCWSESRGMIADNPDQKNFSQQANILGVLYDVVPEEKRQAVMKKILAIEPGTTPEGVLGASYYFRFYLARALDHAQMGNEYLGSLDPWRKLLPLHFSTWPEIPGNTRSDSHAWSAHPIYDLLTLVAGIRPDSAGFATVRIEPSLGSLLSLTATYPHAQGNIQVEYHRQNGSLDATIQLPGGLNGKLVYFGRTWPLKPGANHITAPDSPPLPLPE